MYSFVFIAGDEDEQSDLEAVVLGLIGCIYFGLFCLRLTQSEFNQFPT